MNDTDRQVIAMALDAARAEVERLQRERDMHKDEAEAQRLLRIQQRERAEAAEAENKLLHERHKNDNEILKKAEAELARVKKENDTLRGLLGNSAKDCVYCGLPAAEQGKCARGFPGCARADDQILSQHFADGWRAEELEKELARVKELLRDARHMIDKLKVFGNDNVHKCDVPPLCAAIDAAMQGGK